MTTAKKPHPIVISFRDYVAIHHPQLVRKITGKPFREALPILNEYCGTTATETDPVADTLKTMLKALKEKDAQ